MDAFDFAIYFAAWIKPEVGMAKRFFKEFDDLIEKTALSSESLQQALVTIVDTMGYETFLMPFNANINGVLTFLTDQGVRSSHDFWKLDDISTRHILDQIIMYTNLKEMRWH